MRSMRLLIRRSGIDVRWSDLERRRPLRSWPSQCFSLDRPSCRKYKCEQVPKSSMPAQEITVSAIGTCGCLIHSTTCSPTR